VTVVVGVLVFDALSTGDRECDAERGAVPDTEADKEGVALVERLLDGVSVVVKDASGE
jgi:hypothetical protein